MNTRNRNEIKEILLVHGLVFGLIVVAFVGTVTTQLLTA